VCDKGKLKEMLKNGYKIVNLQIGVSEMEYTEQIIFTFTNLIIAEERVRHYRKNYPKAKITMKISKEDNDRLIGLGLLGDMSLDDALGCDLEVVDG
jgi:hypothetical protein